MVTAYKGADGYVRTTKVSVADSNLDDKGRRTKPARFLERPVHKLVLLQESDLRFIPVEEPASQVVSIHNS